VLLFSASIRFFLNKACSNSFLAKVKSVLSFDVTKLVKEKAE